LKIPVIELSALREHELDPLLEALATLDLDQFDYVSVHAPSRLERWDERHLAARLRNVSDRSFPIVLHPDVITDYRLWADFGDLLCVENMDKRKHVGRTTVELAEVFASLPRASFCFDIGHARQVDPTMSHAVEMLNAFGSRLRQLHVSEVNSRSRHESLNTSSIRAFMKVSYLIPEHIPVILETPVREPHILHEVNEARAALGDNLLDWPLKVQQKSCN
jgi:hypothetical protein